MAGKEKITDGPNERAVDETIAGTGPGIPDEALTPGADLPEPPSDEEVARIARARRAGAGGRGLAVPRRNIVSRPSLHRDQP